MASSPPASPSALPQRPMSAMMRPPRSHSRMSINSKAGLASRSSDEDGRTSVKVVVRVRPPLKSTDPGFELIPQRFQRSMANVMSPTSLAIDSPQGRKLFVFDRVFGQEVDQEGIWEYLVESVNAFVQGYNVSMLAYGQSGAGKSYTMGTSGPNEQADMELMGVIPRAASALFEKLEGPRPASNRNTMSGLRTPTRYSSHAGSLSPKGIEKNWTLKATYLEIYNEQLRDLLVPEHVPMHERGQVTIREDVKGHILLTGLHQVEINSVEDLLNALNFGSTIRQTDSTAINAKSSRSHAVFSLNLVQRKSQTQSTPGSDRRFSVPLEAMTGSEGSVTIDSKLHFVDLAGSERLKNTGAQGDRAKEGISINAGLASLGKVISQLSSRQAGSHVSYRDSKLTRLLQDSLGGNAITYMIACVTPAEFHLSETLNTVQYAQRARAIQSKPQIQQVSDDTDKQALIDRLKAEVAFLRDQIRSSERSDDRRAAGSVNERPERQNEREIELQNQLLDTQESYTTLSQRHAKLISEMTKARDSELADNQAFENTLGDSATERLKRSNSFAEAVEQVVLEYEKTIQSLEQSLSSTRSTLSTTETTLLEKETKFAYMETVNHQLQARLQKLMDRESSTENYLHELEAKLVGHTTGEEKNTAIVNELRKEIARVRESEASCEDYISTLEERLAEADQDTELMQREIERLEHVVERQRSLGKLDNLLYELDHIQQDVKDGETAVPQSPLDGKTDLWEHTRNESSSSQRSREDAILENGVGGHQSEPESREQLLSPAQQSEISGPVDNGESIEDEAEDIEDTIDKTQTMLSPQSLAQSKSVEDKLENVTQELFDLRVEHESTINEFGMLSTKYEEALRKLADLQDEARHRPTRDSVLSLSSATTQTRPQSFLADARVNELKLNGGLPLPSRSLSSELSSAGESTSALETSDAEAANLKSPLTNGVEETDPVIAAEVESLRDLAASTERAQTELEDKYAQLQEQHAKTLDMVEELKTEVSKARNDVASSPRSPVSPVIRRKSSQNVMIIDRAHRSFASLKNIAAENFEDQPDVMQNFELNLNSAMHELHSRSERVQELEADITAVKKEMETKMTIISGLTRERSSLKSSPVDMSVVSTMRDQLLQSEHQIRILQETHSAREKELLTEVDSLRSAIEAHANPSVPEHEMSLEALEDLKAAQDQKIYDLETELANWEGRHHSALASMQASEKELLATIEEMATRASPHESDSLASVDGEESRKQQEFVAILQRDLEEHKAAVSSNSARIADLEQSHATTRAQLDETTKSRDVAGEEVQAHKDLISKLEQQIAEHENVVRSHKDGLSLLQANHAKQLDEITSTAATDHEAKISELTSQHEAQTRSLESELAEARNDLTDLANQVASALGVEVSVEKFQERISSLLSSQEILSKEQQKSHEMEAHVLELSTINDEVMKELEKAKAQIHQLTQESTEDAKVKSEHAALSEQLNALKEEMTKLENKNKKNSRLVGELEDQLAQNFDQHQLAHNRLSTLQTERNAQLEEANTNHLKVLNELGTVKEEYATLQAKLEEMQPVEANGTKRSNSNSQNLRKSSSVASIPSPPPAMPLPPLPGIVGTSTSIGNAASIPVPPTPTLTNRPGSRDFPVPPTPTNGIRPQSKDFPVPPTPTTNTRPPSKDLALAQIQEDQEARIRTIEKHLFAEKQLTATLEEALTDLERQSNKLKADAEAWKRKATDLETENKELKDKPEQEQRWSLHAVEEERKKRKNAEDARAHLEERMNAINKKKKKGSLNCF
ncbi:MAG: hypothetical protein M1818_001768 [Claussenomyces sp. TS43310]|nr:MAG: hypothetical protein M1818_001768 [Claussenomyces sp. TS43310]